MFRKERESIKLDSPDTSGSGRPGTADQNSSGKEILHEKLDRMKLKEAEYLRRLLEEDQLLKV